MISVLSQIDFSNVFVNTNFCVLENFRPPSKSGSFGFLATLSQCGIKPSAYFLPNIMVSTGSVISLTYWLISSVQGNEIQSISPFFPAMKPSMVICTWSFNFLFLSIFCCALLFCSVSLVHYRSRLVYEALGILQHFPVKPLQVLFNVTPMK